MQDLKAERHVTAFGPNPRNSLKSKSSWVLTVPDPAKLRIRSLAVTLVAGWQRRANQPIRAHEHGILSTTRYRHR